MAGVSTPAMAAAVSNAGGLGGLGLGASKAEAARNQIRQTRALTAKPFAVNVFCHARAARNLEIERHWLAEFNPAFSRLGAKTPENLSEIYAPFQESAEMLEMLLEERPALISFHFGLPPEDQINQLKFHGILLLATATNPAEAARIAEAGLDAIIAQGWEAGGHRGCFDEKATDARMSTAALTRHIVEALPLPCIAAGGIMDGQDIRAALDLGAAAVQMGTAFIACNESAASDEWRAELADPQAQTEMIAAISGRPARALRNALTGLGQSAAAQSEVPAYPVAYDAAKQLSAAAKRAGAAGFGVHWAGTGHAQARTESASAIMLQLAEELAAAD